MTESAEIFDKKLIIRPAEKQHLDAVYLLEKENSRRPYTHQITEDVFDSATVFVALLKGECVGYAAVSVVFEDAELINIVVNKKQRGQGIGSRLLAATIHEARQKGAKRMLLEVEETNPALALYQKSGFKQISLREKYYDENNAIIMEYQVS